MQNDQLRELTDEEFDLVAGGQGGSQPPPSGFNFSFNNFEPNKGVQIVELTGVTIHGFTIG